MSRRTPFGTRRGRLLAAACLLAATWGLSAAAGSLKAWPLVYWSADDVGNETQLELLWPLYVRHATDAYAANQVLSFPHDYPDAYPHQYYFAWPLTGLRLAPNGHDAWLFPFLWSGHAPDHRHAVLFPAVFLVRDRTQTRLNIGGLCHNSWGDNGQFHCLFPLLWAAWDDTPTHRETTWAALPLFWYGREEGETTWNTGGTAEHHTWQDDDTWIGPAGWGSSRTRLTLGDSPGESDSRYHALLPFYHQGHTTSLDPKGQTRTDSRHLWLFPYAGGTSVTWQPGPAEPPMPEAPEVTAADTTRLVLPVYWESQAWSTSRDPKAPNAPLVRRHDHDTWALLYWRSDNERLRADGTRLSLDFGRGLFPLLWDFRDDPVTGPDSRSTYLIPVGAYLYRENDFETQNVLGPVFTRCVSQADDYTRYDLLFPLFMAKYGPTISGGRFFPLFGWENRADRYAHRWFLFPLGWDYESQPGTPPAGHDPERWRLDQLESRRSPAGEAGPGASRILAFFPFAWSLRKDGEANSGVMPLGGRNFVSRPPDCRRDSRWWPLLLGQTERWGPRLDAHRQDWLLSALAWGEGPDFDLLRVFPFWSHTAWARTESTWSWLPPFALRSWESPSTTGPGWEQHSRLAVPFAWLPWFRTETRHDGDQVATTTRFVPFLTRTRDTAQDTSELAILWPLYDARWQHGEARIRGLGGIVNGYDRDANGFVDRRLLYRLYRTRERSWVRETELMPFFNSAWREDGTHGWSFLGGLFGAGQDRQHRYVRLLYLPIPVGQPDLPATSHVSPDQHAEFALGYLQANRYDRAALEFSLAGSARDTDAGFQLLAGTAYLHAEPEGLATDLRGSLPDSLHDLSQTTATYNAAGIRERFRRLALERFTRALALGAAPLPTKRLMAHARHDLADRAGCLALLAEVQRDPASGVAAALDLMAVSVLDEGLPADRLASRKATAGLAARLAEQYPGSPTLRLFAAWSRQQAVGPASPTPLPTPATTDSTAARLYEEAVFLDPSPAETEWLQEIGRERADPRCRWLSSGAQQVGLSPWNAGHPAFAAAAQVPALTWGPFSGRNDTPEREAQAAVEARANQAVRIALRLATLAGQYPSVASRPEQILQALEATRPSRWTRRELGEALSPIYARALAAVDPAGRAFLEPRLLRLQFERSYLTGWQLEFAGGDGPRALVSPTPYIDLAAAAGSAAKDHCVARARILCPSERQAVLWFGFDHELAAELNGTPVFGPKRATIPIRDEFSVEVCLRAGENDLRLTVNNDRLAYGFYARISDPAGQYMPDVSSAPPAAP